MPTRGRPKRAIESIKSFLDTRLYARLEVCLDCDDSTIAEVLKFIEPFENCIQYRVSQRTNMAQTFNSACMAACENYDVLGLTADDIIYQTVGWDRQFYEALRPFKFAGVAYGRDGIKDEGLCTHPYFGSVIPRTIGRVLPKEQRHLYIDNNFMAIGDMLGCRKYLPHVFTEHRHFTVHPQFTDRLYLQSNSDETFKHDFQVHRKWVDGTLRCEMDKVLSAAGRM